MNQVLTRKQIEDAKNCKTYHDYEELRGMNIDIEAIKKEVESSLAPEWIKSYFYKLFFEIDRLQAERDAIHKSLDLAEEYRQRAGTFSKLGVQYAMILGQIAATLQHKWRGLEGRG